MIIVFSSAIFRVTNLDLIEFKADEAINIFLASRPLFGYPLPPGGIVSSIGILNPPLFNYFLFPLTYITLDPKIISLVIGLINSLSIGLFFLFVKRYYGLITAFVSSLLFAFSPWSILFSRKIWPQDLLAPLSILFLFSLHKIVIDKKMIYWVIFALSALFLIQLHQASIFFIILVILFLFRQKIRLSLQYGFLGLFLGLIPLVPYILYEIRNGCPDCTSLLETSNRLTRYSYDIFLRILQIPGQGNFQYVLGKDMLTFFQNYPIVHKLRSVFYIEYILLPLGLLLFIKKYKSTRFTAYAVILLPIAYFLFKIEPFMHYFIIVLPVLFIFLATSFLYLFSYRNTVVKFTSIMIFMSILVVSIAFNVSLLDLLKKQKGLEGNYGPVFSLTSEGIRAQLPHYKDNRDYQRVLITNYIPDTLMFGYLPISRMLFTYEKTGDKLLYLEGKWREHPDDRAIRHEILAFHTQFIPIRGTVNLLLEKATKDIRYEALYRTVYEDYLRRNFKKLYTSYKLNLTFDFPQHWSVEEKKEGELIIRGDEFLMTLEKTLSGNLQINNKFYAVTYRPSFNSTFEEIIKSMRGLRVREDQSVL